MKETFRIIYQNEGAVGSTIHPLSFDSEQEAHNWAFENLPYGTLKCRTGCYDVVPTAEAADFLANPCAAH